MDKEVEEEKYFLRWYSWSSPVGLAAAMAGCSILMVSTSIAILLLIFTFKVIVAR
jgi:hypothetical protein